MYDGELKKMENCDTFFCILIVGCLAVYLPVSDEILHVTAPSPASRASTVTCDLLPNFCTFGTPSTILHFAACKISKEKNLN